MRTAPGVQDDDRAVLPALLLAAHHQLAVPGCRPPVHPAELVAVPVRTGDDIVLPGSGCHPRPAIAVVRPAAGRRRRGQRHDLRGDGEGVPGREVRGQLDEAEYVSDPDPQRADDELASQVRTERVADLAGA